MADALADLSAQMQAFVDKRNWKQFHTPRNLATSISIEAAELLECFQWDELNVEEIQMDAARFENIRKEVADVFLYLIRLCSILDIDLIKACNDKIELNKLRYPADEYFGSPRKAPPLD